MKFKLFLVVLLTAVSFFADGRNVCVIVENIPSEIDDIKTSSRCDVYTVCDQGLYFNTDRCQCDAIEEDFHVKKSNIKKIKSCKRVEKCKIGFEFNMQKCKCVQKKVHKKISTNKNPMKRDVKTTKIIESKNVSKKKIIVSSNKNFKKFKSREKLESGKTEKKITKKKLTTTKPIRTTKLTTKRPKKMTKLTSKVTTKTTKMTAKKPKKEKLKCKDNELKDLELFTNPPKKPLKQVSKPNYHQFVKSLNKKNGKSSLSSNLHLIDPKSCPIRSCKQNERFSVMFCSCIPLLTYDEEEAHHGGLPMPPKPFARPDPFPNPKPRPLRAPCPDLSMFESKKCVKQECKSPKIFSFIICRCI